jgi:hypothetical protein
MLSHSSPRKLATSRIAVQAFSSNHSETAVAARALLGNHCETVVEARALTGNHNETVVEAVHMNDSETVLGAARR